VKPTRKWPEVEEKETTSECLLTQWLERRSPTSQKRTSTLRKKRMLARSRGCAAHQEESVLAPVSPPARTKER
jgi:hypothetical protein